jgi:hypothetical protein
MTNYLQDGAEIATMLGGLSVGTGVAVWIRNQVRGQRDRRAVRRHRNWHGYIASGTVSSWHVRIAEDPQSLTGRVVLDVLDGPDGEPDISRAYSLRQQVQADGILARVPTPTEYEFLQALSRERGYGKDSAGFTVR